LTAVEIHIRQSGRDVDLDLDLVRVKRVGLELENALNEGTDAGRSSLRRSSPGEVEKVLDYAAGSVRLLDQESGVVPHVVREALVAAHQLAEGDDRGQRVVQLVGDAGYELAERLHLLGLEQLPLEPVLVREIVDKVEEPALAAQVHHPNLYLRGELGSV
jgi:hypothetical protein